MAHYCTNCGKPLPINSRFCPSCGTKQENISHHEPVSSFTSQKTNVVSRPNYTTTKKTPANDIRWIPLVLGALANLAAFICICIVAYDCKEQLWFHQINGKDIFLGNEIRNSFVGSLFLPVATVILLLFADVRRISIPGNLVMLIGALLAFGAAFYAQNLDLYSVAQLYDNIMLIWLVCAMIYGWTTLRKAFSMGGKQSSISIVICVIWSILFFLFFSRCSSAYPEVLG